MTNKWQIFSVFYVGFFVLFLSGCVSLPDSSWETNSLISALNHKNVLVRSHAASSFISKKDKRAVEPLINALSDCTVPSRVVFYHGTSGIPVKVCKNAAIALGYIGDKRAVGPLITALQSGDVELRCAAATSLGLLKDKRAVEPLVKALKDYDSDVQQYAAEALGKLGDKRAIKPLYNTRNRVCCNYAGCRESCPEGEAIKNLLAELGQQYPRELYRVREPERKEAEMEQKAQLKKQQDIAREIRSLIKTFGTNVILTGRIGIVDGVGNKRGDLAVRFSVNLKNYSIQCQVKFTSSRNNSLPINLFGYVPHIHYLRVDEYGTGEWGLLLSDEAISSVESNVREWFVQPGKTKSKNLEYVLEPASILSKEEMIIMLLKRAPGLKVQIPSGIPDTYLFIPINIQTNKR